MSVRNQIESHIRQNIETRVGDNTAWPVKGFKLEMEKYNIYQDATGIAVDNHSGIEKLKVDGNTYYVEDGTDESEVKDSEIYEVTERFREFLDKSGLIANLSAYVALCKVYSELDGAIEQMELHPEDNFNMLFFTGRTPDAMIRFPGEYNPIEVYNGTDFLNERTDKYDQLMDLSDSEDYHIESSPILINRRSEKEFKDELLERNVVVIDTDYILAYSDIHSRYEDAVKRLNVNSLVHEVPRFEAANGDMIDGYDYDVSEDGDHDYSDAERMDALRPPEDMISDVDNLPDDYLKRVRGGVQLQYVYTLYRRATNSTSTRRAATLVMQETYNNILRANTAVDRDTALQDGWDDAEDQYDWLNQMNKSNIIDEADNIVDEMEEEKILTVPQSGKISPRQATHPAPTFSF